MNSFADSGRTQTGLTLIETLIVVAILALGAWAATPAFVAWRTRDQVDARANALLASLAYARATAIQLQTRVTVCRANDGQHCVAQNVACVSGATDWSCGWAVIFERNGVAQPLRAQAALDAVAITSRLSSIAFTPPAGQAIGSLGNFEIGPRASTASTQGTRWRRCIRIAAGGRARITDGACSAT